MKNNFFNRNSSLFPLRWFLLAIIVISGVMIYANVTGWRLFANDSQQSFVPGSTNRFHK